VLHTDKTVDRLPIFDASELFHPAVCMHNFHQNLAPPDNNHGTDHGFQTYNHTHAWYRQAFSFRPNHRLLYMPEGNPDVYYHIPVQPSRLSEDKVFSLRPHGFLLSPAHVSQTLSGDYFYPDFPDQRNQNFPVPEF